MKATLGQIKAAFGELLANGNFLPGPLHRLANSALPVKSAYWIGRTLDAAEGEFKRIEKQRVELVKKHGVQVGEVENDQWQVPDEKMAEFQAELNDLLKVEVELTGKQFSLDELDGIKLTALDLLQLGFLIAEEGEANLPATVTDISEGRKAHAAQA